ncbi:3',5'-cyclic-nucleotide phosphodiesterase [Rubrivivax gelatinosus]|uniref:3',5'-cyclic-nucleotide phosphodiesterase n=1 Tax=Rubrivivax gelatinosus TaxID=28068 RepID=A0ABS1DV76_RUBGE|nr:3',5'-cyclic-nucleotide phosphodiesterase [Rubrivivax gelatinosus]MBK1614430.1 3',5'-cyclic-nucleotide phosphodiesterase [Rubrivivax gelatinosus]MBK1713026.1 3',5'-cyclic-nucleotide phosphodiesterase [Rubrivivax gelatinosus]
MQIRILGCSGSIAAGNRTTSFLLDDDVLVDAGTGVGELTLDELVCIDHVFVSHSHLDHVLAIGLLADSVKRRRAAAGRPPIRVHALPETLAALQTHVFNGVIWPDFTRLPSPEQPMLEFVPFAVGDRLVLDPGRTVEVLPASHTVPAVGFALVDAAGRTWAYSGDTGPIPALWRRLAQLDLRALIVETAFGDDERALADVSLHLCPALLREELAQLQRPVDVYITHIKPGMVDAVMSEIAALPGPHRVRALRSGQRLVLGD